MALSSWPFRISNLVSTLTPPGLEVEAWLFGSAKAGDDVRDVDVLLVYSSNLEMVRVLELRRRLLECAAANDGWPPLDLVLLTQEEEGEVRFAEKEDAVRVF